MAVDEMLLGGGDRRRRPGRASPAAGISSFFETRTCRHLLIGAANIAAAAAAITITFVGCGDHDLRYPASGTASRLPPRLCRLLCGRAARRRARGASQMLRMLALACALALCAGRRAGLGPAATLAARAPPPYGPPITLDQAKRVMAAAELQAAKNSWQVAITILDSGGNLVMFHKLDNAQLSAFGFPRARRARRSVQAAEQGSRRRHRAGGAGIACLPSRTSRRSRAASPSCSTAQIIGAIGVSGASRRRTPRWRGWAQRR